MSSASPAPLKFLHPGWFTPVMGLGGLSLAWFRALGLMGETALSAAVGIGLLAGLVLAAVGLATALRWLRHPEAWAEDLRHPVRQNLVAAMPIATMLMGTVTVALTDANGLAQVLWCAGAAGQLGVTVWVLSRWLAPPSQAVQWPTITPALFVPIVGNVLAPLGGVPLGHADWATAQFGVGVLFWPVVTTLLVVRVLVKGPWPDRLLPMNFIFIAPPAVVGLSAARLGAPQPLLWMLWGMALFTLIWVGQAFGRLRTTPFGLSHWGMSFPLTAVTALTLHLAEPGGVLAVLAPMLLAFSSVVIAGLLLGTWRGLRDGSLLAPEPVAPIVPVAG